MSLRALLLACGGVVSFLVLAAGLTLDLTGASILGIEDAAWQIIALIGLGFAVVVLGIREYGLHSRPMPRVEFFDLYPDKKTVEIKYYDGAGQQKLERKEGNFQRIRVHNCAVEPSGEGSVAKALCGEVRLFKDGGELVEQWIGRWADLEEADTLGKKWQVDRIDLPPNGQKVTLDVLVSYSGEPGFFRWDNSRFTGDYNANRWMDEHYEISVVLRATNTAAKELRFWVSNQQDKVRFIPMLRRRGKWVRPAETMDS